MKKMIQRLSAMMMLPFMMLLNCPLSAIGAEAAPPLAVEIKHAPVEVATAGQRVNLEAVVTDDSGVEVVRVYFKAAEAADYTFVPMTADETGTYSGVLPAPANGVASIEYLILVQNGNKQVVKSQTYQITVEDADDAAAAIEGNEPINVYSELEQIPTEITGFSDNIVIDAVESAAKLGLVAGLYTTASAGTTTSGAVAGGTVAASAGGISTTAIIVGSVMAVGVVGGGIAVASSSSDDDETSGGSHPPESTLNYHCYMNMPSEYCTMEYFKQYSPVSVGCVSESECLQAGEVTSEGSPSSYTCNCMKVYP